MTPEELKAQEENKSCTGECAKTCADKASGCPFVDAKAKVGDTVYFFDSGIIKSTISKRIAVIVDDGTELKTRIVYNVSGMDIPGDNLYTSQQALIDYANSLDAPTDDTPSDSEKNTNE